MLEAVAVEGGTVLTVAVWFIVEVAVAVNVVVAVNECSCCCIHSG